MLKALFFDMDGTLCDTKKANDTAMSLFAEELEARYGDHLNGAQLAEAYVKAIYREWSDEQRERYQPIIDQQSEGAFRIQLIQDLLTAAGVANITMAEATALQEKFDDDRLEAFDFYPGILEFLTEARKLFTLVVITNGPEFSQIPKVDAVSLANHVDHIIIGGQEPEQKPAPSIFMKALQLAGCEAHEAIHVGDSLAADIAGAHNSKITSVWIQHQQPLDAELGIEPHHTVLSPSEIPDIIRRIHSESESQG
ncbi:MAG: HAD family hydrolase [Porticoccaceae bacterium]|nr:HAD family hydrolase [Porticoccaceae bacterium]